MTVLCIPGRATAVLDLLTELKRLVLLAWERPNIALEFILFIMNLTIAWNSCN